MLTIILMKYQAGASIYTTYVMIVEDRFNPPFLVYFPL